MNDRRLEMIVGNLLRAGVALAAALVAIGGAWYLAVSGGTRPEYGTFHPANGLRELGRLTAPEMVIAAGLLVLIATPVARVVFSIAAFALERDRLYVAITLVVLMVLLYSISTAL
jgi:uncharacterized membrane protein